jgi:death-on-curing protein
LPSEPTFLSIDEVLAIHAHQIAKYGGVSGIHDQGMLESALAAPKATFGNQYLYDTLFKMAAAYLFHLCQNHPFIDGNKRTAAVATRYFLRLNRIDFRPPEEDFEALVLCVARSEYNVDKLASRIELYCQRT